MCNAVTRKVPSHSERNTASQRGAVKGATLFQSPAAEEVSLNLSLFASDQSLYLGLWDYSSLVDAWIKMILYAEISSAGAEESGRQDILV